MQMGGIANLTGWRWIFIIEGILTCLLGIAGCWLLVDFPDSKRLSWRFLGERERKWIVARVNADRGDGTVQKFALGRFLRAGLDWKIWVYALIFFNTTTITYALAFFLPVVSKLPSHPTTASHARCSALQESFYRIDLRPPRASTDKSAPDPER